MNLDFQIAKPVKTKNPDGSKTLLVTGAIVFATRDHDDRNASLLELSKKLQAEYDDGDHIGSVFTHNVADSLLHADFSFRCNVASLNEQILDHLKD